MKHYFENVEEAATALKFSIDDFIDEWLERHDVYDEFQSKIIRNAFRKVGFSAFEDELIQYFENHDDYEFNADDSIVYDDGEFDEDELGI